MTVAIKPRNQSDYKQSIKKKKRKENGQSEACKSFVEEALSLYQSFIEYLNKLTIPLQQFFCLE